MIINVDKVRCKNGRTSLKEIESRMYNDNRIFNSKPLNLIFQSTVPADELVSVITSTFVIH